MTVKTATRKAVILPDGTRINRIIQRIKHYGSLEEPTTTKGKVYIKGNLVDVVKLSDGLWKVIE